MSRCMCQWNVVLALVFFWLSLAFMSVYVHAAARFAGCNLLIVSDSADELIICLLHREAVFRRILTTDDIDIFMTFNSGAPMNGHQGRAHARSSILIRSTAI